MPNGVVGMPYGAQRLQVPFAEIAEKSPFRIAVVGTVSTKLYCEPSRYCSYAKKKKVLFFPL